MSVVIPIFNQGAYIESAIQSALTQDIPGLEVIVVDDGSTDDTADRLNRYVDRCAIIRQPNRGAAAALNRGIRESHGDLVCWLSADDLFLPGKLRAQVRAFEADDAVGLVHTGFEVMRADGSVVDRIPAPIVIDSDPFIAIFWMNPINGSTVMMKRSIFESSGGFDESLRADVDADMWLRVARAHKIGFVGGCLARYRVHSNTLSANRPLMIESMTTVRRGYLRNGEVHRRLAGRHDAALVLRGMSLHFAHLGMDELAHETLEQASAFGLSRTLSASALLLIKVASLRARLAS